MTLNDVRHEMRRMAEYGYTSEENHKRADELMVETIRILVRPLGITMSTARRQCDQILGAYAAIKKSYK